MDRKKILEKVLANKESISEASARVYTVNLLGLAKHFNWENPDYFTTKTSDVIKYLNTLPFAKKKSMLSSLLSFVTNKKAIDVYKKNMVEVANEINSKENKQEKTEKQEKNWESWKDILDTYEQVKEEALPFFKRPIWTASQIKSMMNYVVLSLYVLIPPRRIKDFTDFKIKNIDKKSDNYYDDKKNELVFNSYKTVKNYGEQRVECPKELQDVLDKWIPIASSLSDYLLFNSYGDKLSQPQLTKLINAIFGKKISASMLRHIYISEVVLKNVPKNTELDEIARDMGQSRNQQNLYKKF